jgi:hypothetical protein
MRQCQMRTLQPGTPCCVQVYAFVNDQWQVGSPVKVTTIGQPTKARLTTSQEELESFSTTGILSWTDVPGATGYELWIYDDAGLDVIAESGAGSGRSYKVRRLCTKDVYCVQVYVFVNGQWTTGWATRLDVTKGESPQDCVPPAPSVKLTATPCLPSTS